MRKWVFVLVIISTLLTTQVVSAWFSIDEIASLDFSQIPIDKGRATLRLTLPTSWKDGAYKVEVYIPSGLVVTHTENFMQGYSVYSTILKPGESASLVIQGTMVGTYEIPIKVITENGRTYTTKVTLTVYDPSIVKNGENNGGIKGILYSIIHSDIQTKLIIGIIIIVVILAVKGRGETKLDVSDLDIENSTPSLFKNNYVKEEYEITIDPVNKKIEVKNLGKVKDNNKKDDETTIDDELLEDIMFSTGETLISFNDEKDNK